MKINKRDRKAAERTHEGAHAAALTDEQRLRRSVLAAMLWEDEFYEDGETISARIVALASKLDPEFVAALAIEARSTMNLRHVPLLLLTVLAKTGAGREKLVANTVAAVLQRADEITELVAIYWRNGKKPLPAQFKKGLAAAFGKFDAYQLAKYDRPGPVRLRDVLFLTHAKPKAEAQAETWRKLAENELESPDTWEVALSGGADKRETFERLLKDGKLGYLALLRNLRGMTDAGVDEGLVKQALLDRKGAGRVLPFRFVAAAKAAPRFEPEIDKAMLASLGQAPKLTGKSLVIIDVSGSMYAGAVSKRSDMDRALAACALGAIARELCEEAYVYATAGSDASRVHRTEMVPARRGMALVDAIYAMCKPLGGGGIFLNQVMRFLEPKHPKVDRVIVITDEQDCGVGNEDSPLKAPAFGKHNYLINVASARNGVGYGPWLHLDGFSEAVLAYIAEYETAFY
jgi:60 kDa SS-A/Ro ribonucleoprotein